MESIAIVGMACLYPEARTPFELWENALAQRRAFRRLPPERLRLEDYLDADPAAEDKTYIGEAAVIEGYEFDRVAFRVVGSTYRSADLSHWLALDVASRAFADAGFANGESLPRESTGVVLGNTLTGEFSRANLLRLRWPYVRRTLDAALTREGWDVPRRGDFLAQLEEEYKAPFPPVGEETLAGGLSNTIAGRICNQFDLKGGGYTVDGACASSLLAVANGCSSLAARDLDVALAGGVDLSLDPFEIIGFAKTGALAPQLMRVYDAASAGFWPGEGCGFVVLMRHEDAVAEGHRIYGVIRGWGVSSDGSGGITRPEVDGQLQALNRAYRRAGYGIETVEYFEGHGTGTNVGDATELKVISRARRESCPDAPPAVISSIKANIGHTKAAAGVAGLLKAIMALHTQTLPPATGCERPHAELSGPSPALRILREPAPWPADRPLRAACSAMGFGGINTHVTIENSNGERRKHLTPRQQTLARSPQDAEILLFAGKDRAALLALLEKVSDLAFKLSRSELADLANELQKQLPAERSLRAAVVVRLPAELARTVETLKRLLSAGITAKTDFEAGIFLSDSAVAPRIGFLFPGQGSPAHLTGGLYRRRFDLVRAIYDQAALPEGGDGVPTEIAQPAIVTACSAGLKLLGEFGITASVAVGHSLGEITAMHWAGAIDSAALLRIARVRGRAMADLGSPTGAMAAIASHSADVRGLITSDCVSIVGYNSPRQTVIAGDAEAVTLVAQQAESRGIRAVKLPVSHAFHTPLVARAAPILRDQLSIEKFEPLQDSVVSTISGGLLRASDDLRALLCEQVTSPVRFIEAITSASEKVDVFIEVGPGHVLAGLAADCVEKPVISIDAGGESLRGLLLAVGAAFALGAPVRADALFDGRFFRKFTLDWQPKFFVNPCELAPLPEATVENTAKPALREKIPTAPTQALAGTGQPTSPLEVVRQLVAERAELPLSAVKGESRLLNDLHLNSITVGQLVAQAAKRLGLPPIIGLTDFANATVSRMAKALEEIGRSGAAKKRGNEPPVGLDSWVRPFIVKWVQAAPLLVREETAANTNSQWMVIGEETRPLLGELRQRFAHENGKGVVLCLGDAREKIPPLLLEAARHLLKEEGSRRFVLVQHGWRGAGFARSLHLEHPAISVVILTLPFDHPEAGAWVQRELAARAAFSEVRIDESGTRWEPRLEIPPSSKTGGNLPLLSEDVLLVTGGGKGIASECALALARTKGARLIIMGRSDPKDDPELGNNLQRFESAGIRHRYLPIDVTNRNAVKSALTEVQAEFGVITAFLHAAGSNTPQPVGSLVQEGFEQTLAPKVQGVENVLGALEPERLKLLVTFGSIIGRAGLHGEADYATANEWLTQITEKYQAEHPSCRCLAIEWSVWSGLGMGARLGRIESLRQQGITPITPEAGVAVLEELLANPSLSTTVVVSGRFGELPTITLEKPELPFRRFLEKPLLFYPGVELVVEATLSAASDPYVMDHILHGEPLFPAVMGLEAIAQTAMALARSEEPPVFEKVILARPVVVPRSGDTTIRVLGLLREPGLVEVAVRCEQTGFEVDHFRAVCRFPSAVERLAKSLANEIKKGPRANATPLPIEIGQDIYEPLLFHTGRFRRVKNYRLLRARECIAQLEPDAEATWFARYLPEQRVLGDAGVRDAAIHAIQACIPHSRLLPVGVEQIVIGKIPCLLERVRTSKTTPELLLHARETKREGDTFVYDLELVGEDGSVLEQWSGLCLKRVEQIHRTTPWPIPLLGPYIERRLEELRPGSGLSIALQTTGEAGARDTQSVVQELRGASVKLQHRSDGKPEISSDQNISVAHRGELTLVVTARGAIGCDIEHVSARVPESLRDLLNTRFPLAERIAAAATETLDASATRVWSAIECLRKAGAPAEAPLVLETVSEDRWVLLRSGKGVIASCLAEVRGVDAPVIISVLSQD